MPTAPLKRRLISLLYEALLAGAVGIMAALAAGMVSVFLNTAAPILTKPVTTLILLAAWWFYFKANWRKTWGQTLPMRVWSIGLANTKNRPPTIMQLRLRFLWACILIIFIPLIAYAILRHSGNIPPRTAFIASLMWWVLPWGFALLNPDKQFLYDYLAGTRLIDLRGKHPKKCL